MFAAAFWIVRFYYVINLYFVYDQLATLRDLGLDNAAHDAVWPVFWIDRTGPETASLLILHLSLAAGMLGVLFWQRRWVRIVVIIAQLLVGAFANSFGAMNHGYHEWFWLGFCFVFLPQGHKEEIGESRQGRMSFLMVFSMAQGLVLLFYSLSGLSKVADATLALGLERVGGFAPEAMALTLANRMIQTNSTAIWAPFIIENYWVGWPLFLGVYFIEVVAIFVFLRPELHRLWGLMLIAFHIGTFLFMAISFAPHVLINTMLFVLSPFAAATLDWRAMLRQLPVLGILLARLCAPSPIRSPAARSKAI